MLSIAALLLVIFAVINTINFTMISEEADRVTERLAKNNGQFGPNPGQEPQDKPIGPDSPEIKFSTRYFAYQVDKEGNYTKLAFQISFFTEEEALEIAKSISNGSVGWVKTYYRFRVYEENNIKYIIVIDYGRELNPSFKVLWISLIGSLSGLVVSFFVLLFVAKKLIEPLVVSDRKQRRFIKDATRELKAPLTIIASDNELLREKLDSNLNDSISRQLDKMDVLVKNMHTLLILEDENFEKIEKDEFKLNELIQNGYLNLKEKFEEKNLNVIFDIDEVLFNGNLEMMNKMVKELLDNACKYAKSSVEVILKKSDERINLIINNDAVNLPDGPLDRIFEKFYRLDEMVEKAEGNGMGLAIVDQIVKLHGGRVSAIGKDNIFTIKVAL